MTPNITLNVTITTPEAAAALLHGLGIQQPSAPPAAINPTILPPEIMAPPTSTAPAAHTVPSVPTPAYAGMPQQPPAVPAPAYAAAPQQTPCPAVPTAAPAYTYEDLARAAAPLMDAGKINDVLALIQSFGVQALTQLPKEQYGAFATALRGMGARI